MTFSQERKISIRGTGFPPTTEQSDTVPMHPDDFEAHLAWIMAKRFHEMGLKKTFS
jgi:hypothetical protein